MEGYCVSHGMLKNAGRRMKMFFPGLLSGSGQIFARVLAALSILPPFLVSDLRENKER